MKNQDTTNRTLQLVEVIYFSKKQFKERKHIHYTPNEAVMIYDRTIEKFKNDTQEVIVLLQDENLVTVKAFRNF